MDREEYCRIRSLFIFSGAIYSSEYRQRHYEAFAIVRDFYPDVVRLTANHLGDHFGDGQGVEYALTDSKGGQLNFDHEVELVKLDVPALPELSKPRHWVTR